MKRITSLAFVVLAACANKIPETRYYQLAAPTTKAQPGSIVLVVEPLSTEGAYDDERIVYRTNPYRLDYYQYHRWSAPPGVLIGNYLEQAFEKSGRFRAVVREANVSAAVSLGGRIVAIEEVDQSKQRWIGRIVLELSLTDTHTGEIVWTEQFEETELMTTQHPEGLARALSNAMERIAKRAGPQIAEHAEQRAAQHAATPVPMARRARER
ncbi:MAG TPA: ABC-type transport auxiliary lipoprotein family protein [Kofleriaceae bacterium]|nr:ABC-type transport auxiliary lipoprotein family protein [Kofleriaceae bacterium]